MSDDPTSGEDFEAVGGIGTLADPVQRAAQFRLRSNRMQMDDDAFEWDENKRLTNLEKHEIDFRDAVAIFDKPVVDVPSARRNEDRRKALGWCDDILIAVIYTGRDDKRRIISARPAGKDERALYHEYHPARGSPAAGRD